MIPRSIIHQLAKLRQRETLLRLCWGISRCLAVVIPFLILACAIDYFLDRTGYEDTPQFVRFLLFSTQIGVAAGVAGWWIAWPILRQPTEADLALYVEEKMPGFHHRLISTVQLNQPGARKEGMSQELIDVVTRETEKQAEQATFAALADHRRALWSAGLAGPILLIGLLLLFLVPLAPLLLARQLPWVDEELPRSVRLENITKATWPTGESVLLKFKVTGIQVEAYQKARKEGNKKAMEDALDEIRYLEGHALVETEGQPNEKYDLKFAGLRKDGDEGALFTAQLPSKTENFMVSAKLGDGRTRRATEITFVSRPVVTEIRAWLQLPKSCGLRPGNKRGLPVLGAGTVGLLGSPFGQGPFLAVSTLVPNRRFELPPTGGDIVAIPDSAARVEITLQNPVKVASLILLSDKQSFEAPAKLIAEAMPLLGFPEGVLKDILDKNTDRPPPVSVELKLNAAGTRAVGEFELRTHFSQYRIEVADEHQFKNSPQPTRGIKTVAEAPPTVTLLPTMMLPPGRSFPYEDEILDGMPIPEGKPVPIAFTCSGRFGLHHAQLKFSFPKKIVSGETPVEEEHWEPLDLLPKTAGPDTGPFIQRVGRFLNTEETSFHAIPGDPAKPELLGQLEGGGNFFFQTSNLSSRGKEIKLKAGDQIAFYVEVFAGPPESGRPSARSEIRVVNVVTYDELAKWHQDRLDERNKIKKILDQQNKNTPAGQ
jgi:hypothetical protein